MMTYLLSFVVLLVCVGNLKGDSTGDLDSLMAEVKTLRHEMTEGFSRRDNEITALKEQMVEDAATAVAAAAAGAGVAATASAQVTTLEDKLTAIENDLKLEKIMTEAAAAAAAASATSAEVTALEDKLAAVENDLKLEKMMTGSLKQQMQDLQTIAKPRHSQEEDQIAFSVYSENNFGPNTVYTNIPFPLVRTNIGGAWQAHINSFQAARAGVYLFSASMRGQNDGSNAHGAIVLTTPSGSERTVHLYSPPNTYTGDANVVILEVDVGDYVSVQLDGGEIYSSSSYRFSTFSGFLIF